MEQISKLPQPCRVFQQIGKAIFYIDSKQLNKSVVPQFGMHCIEIPEVDLGPTLDQCYECKSCLVSKEWPSPAGREKLLCTVIHPMGVQIFPLKPNK